MSSVVRAAARQWRDGAIGLLEFQLARSLGHGADLAAEKLEVEDNRKAKQRAYVHQACVYKYKYYRAIGSSRQSATYRHILSKG